MLLSTGRFFNGAGGGGGGAGGSFSYVGGSGASATSITMPTVEAGDIAIFYNMSANTTAAVTAVIPSGFTEIDNQTSELGGTYVRTVLAYKICDGTEDGATLNGMNGNVIEKIAIAVVRPVGFSPSTVAVGNSGAASARVHTNGNPAAQVIPSTGVATPAICIGTGTSSGVITTWSMTGEEHNVSDGTPGIAVGVNLYADGETLSDVTIDEGDHGFQNVLFGAFLEAS